MATPLPLNHRRWVLLLVAAQMLFILAVAAAGYATTAYGRVVTLRTLPVDPRDLLYGDYVRLNYTISQVPISLWQETTLPRRRQAVYVVLRPTGEAYEAVRVFAQAPTELPTDQIVLRGWIEDRYRRSLHIRYNLERYYVPEGKNKELEGKGRQHTMLVHVSIAPWGQARITEAQVLP
jgi:uncharacterized membrane-anchored protein